MISCLQEKQIPAYVDGALDSSAKQEMEVHLRSCSICQERARKFEKLNLLLQEWTDNRPQMTSEIPGFYEGAIPSDLEKMTVPESDEILNRLVRKLRNTPQKILWFRPRRLGVNEEYLTPNQKFEECITPQERVEGLAAYSATPFEKLYCQRLSLPDEDLILEFRIGNYRGRNLATLFLGGTTLTYPDRYIQITLVPSPFLRELGVEWDPILQKKDDGNLVLMIYFDEDGWLENKNERLALISPEAAESLLKYLTKEGTLVEELQAEVIDESIVDLLKRIPNNLPPKLETRLKQLREKRQAETLTESEYAELIKLLDEVEQWNVSRIEALSQLAQKTGRRLADLAKELGIGNNEVI